MFFTPNVASEDQYDKYYPQAGRVDIIGIGTVCVMAINCSGLISSIVRLLPEPVWHICKRYEELRKADCGIWQTSAETRIYSMTSTLAILSNLPLGRLAGKDFQVPSSLASLNKTFTGASPPTSIHVSHT
jgi:hypothetical protein